MGESVIIYQVFNARGGWLGNFRTLRKAEAVVAQVAGAYIVAVNSADLI